MNIISSLKQRYKGYKEKRFLETHGCKTWREYERRYDSDVGPMARWAHTYYHGYPHLFSLEPTDRLYSGMTKLIPYHYQSDKMVEWCEKNCTGKWRNDWHRGSYDTQDNFELDGILGEDIMFFAFKEESDYAWFMLRWS